MKYKQIYLNPPLCPKCGQPMVLQMDYYGGHYACPMCGFQTKSSIPKAVDGG